MQRGLGKDSSDCSRWTVVWTCNSDRLLNQRRFSNGREVLLMCLETFVISSHIDGACCLGQLLEKFKVLCENPIVFIFAREVVRAPGTASLAQHLLSLRGVSIFPISRGLFGSEISSTTMPGAPEAR